MSSAYQRELRQIPILIEMTSNGIRIARGRLKCARQGWEAKLATTEQQLRRVLNAPTLNLDSGEQLANALKAAGMVEEFRLTRTGLRSIAREALAATVVDPDLLALLEQRNDYVTRLRWATPLLELSEADMHLHVAWNPVPYEAGGARTGRIISSGPNLQGLPSPLRPFIIPEFGGVLLRRDFSQQELRVFAVYEKGAVRQQFIENPRFDLHSATSRRASDILGWELSRRVIKIVVFSIMYGAGVKRLARQLRCSFEEARAIHAVTLEALPGLAKLKRRMESVSSFVTWGGRIYRVGQRSDAYKRLNTLIQGSSADYTKTVMANAADAGLDLRITVHDELVIASTPGAQLKRDMATLREVMENAEFDVPMRSDGKWSVRSLGEMNDYRD